MSDQTVIPPARSFAQFLAEIEGGALHTELSNQLRDIVAELSNRVLDGARSPKATLTVSFDLKLEDGVFEIVPDMKVKMPKSRRGRSIFWATPENNLTPQNPRQQALPFRDVTAERDVRSV